MAPIASSVYPSSTAFFETAPSPTSLWIGEYVPGKGFWAGAAAPDEVNPSPVRSTHSIVGNAPDTPDTSLHQFLIYMVILAVCFFVCCVYILEVQSGRGNVQAPGDRSPPRSATVGRSGPWDYYQQRPFYVSQADMLSNGSGLFG